MDSWGVTFTRKSRTEVRVRELDDNPFPDDAWADNPFRQSSLFREFKRIGESGDFAKLEGKGSHQHLVPRFVLSNFATKVDRGRVVFQLDTATGMNRRLSVRDAATRSNFFTMTDEEGKRHTRLEGYLSLIDDHGAQALRRLLEDALSLPDGDRATLAFMIAILEHRTFGGSQRAQAAVRQTMQRTLGAHWADPHEFAFRLEHQRGEPVSLEEAEELRQRALSQLRDGSLRFSDEKAVAFQAAFSVAYQQAVDVFSMSWRLLRGEGFVTSDRGLAIYDPAPRFPWVGSGILSSPLTETTIPLAPDACLLLTPTGDELLNVEEVNAARVNEINLRTYGWADRFAIARRQDQLQELRQRAKSRPAEVVRPRPHASVHLLPIDPTDPTIGDRNLARGWPRYLYGIEGSVSDYVVVDERMNSVDAIELVRQKSQERIERALAEKPVLKQSGPGIFRTMVTPNGGIRWQFFPESDDNDPGSGGRTRPPR
jgi:hypothetical protein